MEIPLWNTSISYQISILVRNILMIIPRGSYVQFDSTPN